MVPVIRNRNWMPNWLDDFFGDDWNIARVNQQYATPSVNIIENEGCFCIEVAAPGMTKDDFRVSLNEGNELVVSLEKYTDNKPAAEGDKEKSKDKKTYLRREFSYSSFRRTFILPETVDKEKISAKMKNGVLTLDLPKKEETKRIPAVREIAIG